MDKDFDSWNTKKKRINQKLKRVFFHEREIWWCTLGVNIGSEQDGSGGEYRRPVLIIKGFSSAVGLVVPLTTSLREHRLRFSIGEVEGKKAKALLSQVRVVDASRLVRKIGYLEKDIFEELRKTVKALL